MKKLKMTLSCILAIVMLAVSSVPAFATEDDSFDLDLEKNRIMMYADDCEQQYIYYYSLYIMNAEVPRWSDESRENMKNVIAKVRDEVDNCETIEEVESYRALLAQAEEKMCISSTELQFMLDLMEDDYNSTGYYDEETYAKLKEVYEEAQKALELGVDREIHVAYVNMRNEFNELCVYNQIPADVTGDGSFDIKDCTFMQLNIANFVDFTSSQYFITGYRKDTKNIKQVTNYQLLLANLLPESSFSIDQQIEQILKYKETYGGIDVNLRNYLGLPENGGPEKVNYMYYYKRYINHDEH